MTTAGNAHTSTLGGVSTDNPHTRHNAAQVQVSDPTTDGNGDVGVNVDSLRNVATEDDVAGVSVTGAYRARVQGVSGNTVTVRITEPDGAGGFAAVTGTELTGETLEVTATD